MLLLDTNQSTLWTLDDIYALGLRLTEAEVRWAFRTSGKTEGVDGIEITRKSHEFVAQIVYRAYVHDHITPRKEIDMTATKTTLISDAEAQVARAIADLERAQANLAKAQKPKYPDEPGDGFTIAFSLIFEPGQKTYEFAARNIAGSWYTTGSTCPRNGYSWEKLIDWMREAHFATKVNVLGYSRQIEVK